MYFLVDFENVRSNGLRGADYLDKSDYLTLFFSSAAHSCENRYLEEIEQSGCVFDTCKLVKIGKNGVDINVFQAKYEEHRRLQEVLTQIFGSTIFADRLEEIQDLLENGENKKIIYLSSLRRFGRKQGLEIYDRLKPILYQEA